MKFSATLSATALLVAQQVLADDIWLGGYSGLYEVGGINTPALAKSDGTWIAGSLDCNVMSTGGLSTDVNDSGELLYNWCDAPFSIDGQFGGGQVHMGGDNQCNTPCDTEDKCTTGNHFADLLDENNNKIGDCDYDQSWNEDCANNGSHMYSTRVHCHS